MIRIWSTLSNWEPNPVSRYWHICQQTNISAYQICYKFLYLTRHSSTGNFYSTKVQRGRNEKRGIKLTLANWQVKKKVKSILYGEQISIACSFNSKPAMTHLSAGSWKDNSVTARRSLTTFYLPCLLDQGRVTWPILKWKGLPILYLS